jgi:hypothetical protein
MRRALVVLVLLSRVGHSAPLPTYSFETKFSNGENVELSFAKMNEAIEKYNRSTIRGTRSEIPKLSMKGKVQARLSESARNCAKFKPAEAQKSLLFPMGYGKWYSEGYLALDSEKGTLGYHANVDGRWYYCQMWGPRGFTPNEPKLHCEKQACEEESYRPTPLAPLDLTAADYRVAPLRVAVGSVEYPTYRLFLKLTPEKFQPFLQYFSHGQDRARVEATLTEHLKDGEIEIKELLPEFPRKYLYQIAPGAPTSYTMARYFFKREPLDGRSRTLERGSENSSDPIFGLLDTHYCETEEGQHFGDLFVDSSKDLAGRALVGPYLLAKPGDDPNLPLLILETSSDKKNTQTLFNSWRMVAFHRCH